MAHPAVSTDGPGEPSWATARGVAGWRLPSGSAVPAIPADTASPYADASRTSRVNAGAEPAACCPASLLVEARVESGAGEVDRLVRRRRVALLRLPPAQPGQRLCRRPAA